MRTNSSHLEIAAAGPDRIEVRGALTFRTARRASEEGLRAIQAAEAQSLTIDCGGIQEADSAGLAVLIYWLAHARRAGRALRYVNLPPAIRSLARIGEIEETVSEGVPA